MSSMKEKKLRKKVIVGLLGVSLLTGGYGASYLPQAESASLYSEYQKEQKLEELKKQVEEVRRELAEAEKAEREEKARVAKEKEKEAEQARKAAEEKKAKELAEKEAAKEAEKAAKAREEQKEKESSEPKKYNTYAKSAPREEVEENPNSIIGKVDRILTQHSKISKKSDGPRFKMDNAPQPKIPPTPPEEAQVFAGTTGNQALYDFDWRGTPLAQSLYGVAKLAGKGVVVNGKLEGTVFMSLKQVTCDQALNYLSNAFGVNWMTDGNNIVISTAELMKQSATLKVSYANKENLVKEFKSIGISEENIFANPETGTVSVTGTPYQISEAKKRLRVLDKPVSQCLILAQLIEVNHGSDVDLGISYEMPSYSHAADPTSSSGTLEGRFIDKMAFGANVHADRALAKGKVIARPMTLALNGQKGTVNFGDKVPILTKTATTSSTSMTVTYQDVGTRLEVTPVINEETGEISMTISTEVSNITSWQNSGDTRAPQISSRSATTSTHVKSGQSFVIGGLMSSKDLDNLQGIPGLMDLPILGKLFSVHNRSKSFSEVYIMITPFILTDDVNVRDIYDELKYMDGKAKKNDVYLPPNDWSNDIGKHAQKHEAEPKPKDE